MKILIAEHAEKQRRELAQLLENEGHEIVSSATCSDTVAKFARYRPDLVLMDVALPDGDGYRCTRMIAALAGERFVPVILSTAISDQLTLTRFLDSGATDFIDEPHNVMVLRAKLAGYERMRALYGQVERFRSKVNQEIRLAKHMFDSVLSQSPSDLSGLRHWTVTAGHFSGDLLVYEATPDGQLHIMMGDFTGHGLSAAVGAVPAADAFFDLTRKGRPLAEIVAHINDRLHHLLPTGHFCAATLVRLDTRACSLDVWNGGQPPLLLIDDDHRIAHQVPSRHFPLSMASPAQFDAATDRFSLDGIRHIVLCSDGLLEAQNPRGEAFGEDGLASALTASRGSGDHVLHSVKSRLIAFLDGSEPHDDVSLLTVDLAAA